MSDDLAFGMESAKSTHTWSTVKSAHLKGGSDIVNRHRTEKRVANGVASAASLGVSGAQFGTGTSALAVGGAVAAGAAVSATGIGLVVAGGALTIGSVVTNAVSLGKTIAHCENLKDIKARYDANGYSECECLTASSDMAKDHDWIGTKILPYIIQQKTEKAVKKGVSTVGLGVLTTLYSMGRSAYKSLNGTKGTQRSFNAHVLARHLITHECSLAQHIVAELLSPQEMAILMEKDSDVVGAAVAEKMKSV